MKHRYNLPEIAPIGLWTPNTLRFRVVGAIASTLALVSCGVNSPTEVVTPEPVVLVTPTIPEVDPTACAKEGEPPNTLQEKLCEDRRVGELTVVTVPGLEPTYPTMIDLNNPAEVTGAVTYATDLLRLATDGAINLTPNFIEATEETTAAIRDRNGGDCIKASSDSYMSTIVREKMPAEVASATQLVAIGGEWCDEVEGDGTIGGIARLSTEQTEADVYNRLVIPFLDYSGKTNAMRVGNIIAHEELHNFGLDHAGQVSFNDSNALNILRKDPSGIIDLNRLLEDITYDEYGAYGNVMANVGQPLEPGATSLPAYLLNALQIDHLSRGIDPEGYTPKVLPFQLSSDTLTVNLQDPSSLSGVSVPLPKYIEAGGHKFSDVNFLVTTNAGGVSVADIVLSTPYSNTDQLSVGNITSIPLDESRPLLITVGHSKVSITCDGDMVVFTKLG